MLPLSPISVALEVTAGPWRCRAMGSLALEGLSCCRSGSVALKGSTGLSHHGLVVLKGTDWLSHFWSWPENWFMLECSYTIVHIHPVNMLTYLLQVLHRKRQWRKELQSTPWLPQQYQQWFQVTCQVELWEERGEYQSTKLPRFPTCMKTALCDSNNTIIKDTIAECDELVHVVSYCMHADINHICRVR